MRRRARHPGGRNQESEMAPRNRGEMRRSPAEEILSRYSAERQAELHDEALELRRKLRNGELLEPEPEPKPEPEPEEEDPLAAQRAKFAAAVARAEFGRFYWKAPPVKKRSRNGAVRPTPRAAPKSPKPG
jgi:hypothetical protein